MPAKAHSGNRRTRAPFSSSRRQAQPLVEVMPKPATAAAIAPSFSSVEQCGSTAMANSCPSRSKRQAVGTAAAVPPDDAVAEQVLGRLGRTGAGEIVGRGHDHPRDRRNTFGRRRRIREPSQPDGNVHGVAHQILPAIPELKLDMQVRMTLRKRRKARDDIANTEAGRHAHAQQAAQFAALAHAVLCLVQGGENRLDARQELAPRLGGHDRARRARKEPHAKFAFQVGHDSRRLGLGEATLPRGGREAAQTRDTRIEAQSKVVLDHELQGPTANRLRKLCIPINVSHT